MCSTISMGVEADVTSADTALTRALHEGVEHLCHDQLTALLAQLCVMTAKADALTLALVGRVDADGTYALDGALTAGAWVRATAHQTPGEAARTVRTARTLRSGVLPNTTAALAAGAISGRHAAAIADGVKDAPADAVALIEPEAVAFACEGDVRATSNLMRRSRRPWTRTRPTRRRCVATNGPASRSPRCSAAGSPSPAPPTRPPAPPSSPRWMPPRP